MPWESRRATLIRHKDINGHEPKAGKEPVSAIVLRALAREMEADAVDFAKLAAPYQGMFSGPADLSSREDHGSR